MHPIIPFITETIWWKLNEVRPHRGLPGRIDCSGSPSPAGAASSAASTQHSGLSTQHSPSKRLIKAAWPTVGDFSQAAEFIFPKLQEIIIAIRNIRNEYKIESRKSVTVSIQAPGDSARQIEVNRGLIELLANCTLRQVTGEMSPPPNSARATAAGCDIYVENLIDPSAEAHRTAKRREELTKKIANLEARLANPGYVAKAPPALIKQTQDELAEAKADLAKLQ
jgi:valyl-tRNA synthetase